MWEVSWGNTPRGQTDKQRCPMGPGRIVSKTFILCHLFCCPYQL